jgi:hypothetical protein
MAPIIPGASRIPLEQTFFNITVAVGLTATPLNNTLDIGNMIQSFSICNPSFNANSVFFGDSNVTASSAGPAIGTGLEIPVGSTQSFTVRQERQFYEIQDPDLQSAQALLAANASQAGVVCMPLDPVMIPVIVWKPSNIYLVAAVATTVAVCFFRNVYV